MNLEVIKVMTLGLKDDTTVNNIIIM